ncbi:MAG TPA: AMP-dependent synthetase, partial [Nitrososphaera sp.]|nr:AMP-dependent synthetase [Nitrososphaera sp.]
RADDVIKVVGHRIGTAEVEAAATSHPAVAEVIAVGRPDELKGEAIVVYIVVKNGYKAKKILADEIITRVEEAIGTFARPQEVRIVTELPKTRTGKLVRRLVKAKLTEGNIADQDLSILENPWSLEGI